LCLPGADRARGNLPHEDPRNRWCGAASSMVTRTHSSTDRPLPVLVTGAAGFVGARLIQALTAAGSPVFAVDTLTHFAARPEHEPIDSSRIVDVEALPAWLDAAPPLRAIVHLGACTDTRETDRAYLTR